MTKIELLPNKSLVLSLIDLPQNYKVDEVNVFYSAVENEEDLNTWNESNPIHMLLTQAEKLELIDKCPENFGDVVIVNNEVSLCYDEQDDILDYFEIHRHGFVIREYKNGFILIVQNGLKDLKNDDYERQGKEYDMSADYWDRRAFTRDEFTYEWTSHLDQLKQVLDTDNDTPLKDSIHIIQSRINDKSKDLLEVGDEVEVDIDYLRRDHHMDIVTAHHFIHVLNEVNKSEDKRLVIARINAKDCLCYAKGIMTETITMPIIHAKYLKLKRKGVTSNG